MDLQALIKEVESLKKRVALLESKKRKPRSKSVFVIPTKKEILEEVIMMGEFELSAQIANEFFNYWNDRDWKNKRGQKMKNWKLTLKNGIDYSKSKVITRMINEKNTITTSRPV